MQISEIEQALNQLAQTYKEKIDSDSSITSIYVFGSYVRGDFSVGKSDLNFAVFLDVPGNTKYWNHPDLVVFKYISENIINSLPDSLFRPASSLTKFNPIVYSLGDFRQVLRNEPIEIKETLENLTFLAFDFFENSRLIWGKDVLKESSAPDPMTFKDQHFNYIKTYYLSKKERNPNSKKNIFITLEYIIQYYAILDGIRDIRKETLKEWSDNSNLFSENEKFKTMIDQYFMYQLLDNPMGNKNIDNTLDDNWKVNAREFIESILGK